MKKVFLFLFIFLWPLQCVAGEQLEVNPRIPLRPLPPSLVTRINVMKPTATIKINGLNGAADAGYRLEMVIPGISDTYMSIVSFLINDDTDANDYPYFYPSMEGGWLGFVSYEPTLIESSICNTGKQVFWYVPVTGQTWQWGGTGPISSLTLKITNGTDNIDFPAGTVISLFRIFN